MKKEKNKYWSNIAYILNKTWKHDRIMYLWIIFSGISYTLVSLLGVYLPMVTVSGLENKWKIEKLLFIIVIFTFLLALFNYIKAKMDSNYFVTQEVSRHRYLKAVSEKVMTCNYYKLESPETQVKINQVGNLVYTGASNVGINGVQNNLKSLIITLLGSFTYIAVLKSLGVVIVILRLINGVGYYWLSGKSDLFVHKNRDSWAVIDKKISYTNDKLTRSEFAKDIRNFNCTEWLMKKLNSLIFERSKWFKKVQRKKTSNEFYKSGLSIAIDIGVFAYIIYMVLDNRITVSQFILYWGAANQLSGFFEGIFNSLSKMRGASLDVSIIRSFLDSDNIEVDRETSNKKSEDMDVSQGISIRFEHIYFKYDNTDSYIIKDFNTIVNAGEKISLVGMNGAGKTTLIKLLCGFYKPTKGNIYINDIPIDEISNQDMLSLISAVFQDSIILPFSVAQNIALTPNESINYDKVHKCIETAGLSERLKDVNLPLVKAANENGIELSGGEKQKLFLARALYKDSDILILDEPTAALDPLAERDMYLKYGEFSEGKTVIFISHRLASTSFCDRILFLKDGCIHEEGTHEQLIDKGGEYFEVFNIQKKYYQDKLGEGVYEKQEN